MTSESVLRVFLKRGGGFLRKEGILLKNPVEVLKEFAPLLGHTPSTAGTFRRKLRKNSGMTPETLSELFLEFPSRLRLGSPQTL